MKRIGHTFAAGYALILQDVSLPGFLVLVIGIVLLVALRNSLRPSPPVVRFLVKAGVAIAVALAFFAVRGDLSRVKGAISSLRSALASDALWVHDLRMSQRLWLRFLCVIFFVQAPQR